MTTPRARYVFMPLTMTWAEVAEAAFRKSETWLRGKIGTGELADFPKPDAALDLFSRKAVENWIDQRFGHAPPSLIINLEDDALEAAKGGIRGRRPASGL